MPPTFWSRVREARLIRVVAVYLAASWLILQATALFIQSFDLPKWFMPAAVLLLLIGLVIITATAWVQSHPLTSSRARAEEIPGSWEIDLRDVGRSVTRGRLPHLTWARAILGGVVAFSLLFGLVGVYVLVRDRGRSFSPPEAVAGAAAPGIAVLPFSVSSPRLEEWREGMVDLLSTNLDGAAGVLLAGDAALFIDPFTGQGIYLALRSAEMAFEVGAAALAAGCTSAGRLAAYDRWRRSEFGSKVRLSRLLQGVLYRPWLAREVAATLRRDRRSAQRLIGVIGDYRPAGDLLRPGLLTRLLTSGLL
jgi:hypothetical protein